MYAVSDEGVPLSGTSTSIELVGGAVAAGSVGDAMELSVVTGEDSTVDVVSSPPHDANTKPAITMVARERRMKSG